MKLTLKTWNSLNINDGSTFNAYIPPGQLANLSANPITVNRTLDFPFLSGTVQNANVFVIGITVASGADISASRETLKKYFNISDPTRHNLVAHDAADSNRPFYLTGFPVRISPDGTAPNSFFVTLQVEYPYWRVVTPITFSWSITASGQSSSTTNIGNLSVKPKFTVTPTTTKAGGLLYRRYVPIYNNTDKTYSAPVDITNGGLDTGALTTAKMQADGDDLRVWMDGAFVDRWLSAMDTANTKVWINLSLSARKEGVLLTTVNDSIQTLAFAKTKASTTFLKSLKGVSNKVILIESEAIVFDPANIDFINFQITSVTRGAKSTTAASHTAPKTARHIEHDLFILYGDSTLADLETDDKLKPIFDLTSTNTSITFTNYYDTTANRPGAWKGEVLSSKTSLSYPYTATENAFANPSTVMGLVMAGGADFQIANEAGSLEWLFTHPAGMTAVTYSGESYTTASWPALIGLQYLRPNTAWFTAQLETVPTVTQTWQAFGPHVVSFGGTFYAIRHVMEGQLNSTVSELAGVEFDTHTITLDSNNTPTFGMGAETAINFFDFVLTNTTTNLYIKVTTPCILNTALVVDCQNKTAYLADKSPVLVTLSTNREAWLDLASGSNNFQYDDTGTAAVTLVIDHEDRNL